MMVSLQATPKRTPGLMMSSKADKAIRPIGQMPASENCAIQIASKLGAQCLTLHAPALISNAELAERLRSEHTIDSQIARLKGYRYVDTEGHEMQLPPSDRIIAGRIGPQSFGQFGI
ncbi:MAG: hypothetical protein AAFY09_14895 [Pseudomonadota bacterium]